MTTFVSSTSLQVALTASDALNTGMGELTVSNPPPDASVSAGLPVTIIAVPVPAIHSVMPSSVPANAAATGTTNLVIAGTNFLSSSTVTVNSRPVTTSSITATSITAVLPANYIQQIGQLSIQVINPGNPPAVSTAAVVNVTAMPTISAITPSAAPLRSHDLQITVTGNGFFPDSLVQWNGTPLTTTSSSSFGVGPQATALTATIPAADLATFAGGSITVVSPEEAPTTTSSAQAFSTYLPISVNQIAYSPTYGLLFVSVPGAAGSPLGNSLVSIDPVSGAVDIVVRNVGSEPNALAISDDGTALYVGLDGAGAVLQVNLNSLHGRVFGTAGRQFSLGGESGLNSPPSTAVALAVLPGQPNSVAVADSTGVVTIYDSGVGRPQNSIHSFGTPTGPIGTSICFGPTVSTLYALNGSNQGTFALSIDVSGISSATQLSAQGAYAQSLQYDNGHLYLSDGTVLDASTGATVGHFESGGAAAIGPVVSDSSIRTAWILPNPLLTAPSQVLGFNETTFDPAGLIDFSGFEVGSLVPFIPTPFSILRWGPNGLAFASSSQVYSLQSSIVQDLSSSPGDVSVAITAPASATTGSNLTYTITINNTGPSAAQNIVVVSTSTDGAQSEGVEIKSPPSPSHCNLGSTLVCTISSLASGASESLEVTIIPNAPGAFLSNASVSSVSYDPNPANNQATATTTVTGIQLSLRPFVASLSPSLIRAGTDTFALTINGRYFDLGSVVNWNGDPLPTTLVSSTQLTATVDKSLIATLGWGGISVTNAAPGGGSSRMWPLTVYQVLAVQANQLAFDPFTRDIYATIPSAWKGVAGNSLLPIDPGTGKIGTPLPVGREPNLMAETSDGNFLWIGLDGANSLGKFNLVTQTLDGVVPIALTTNGFSGTIPAVGLAAQPGNDVTVAIDTGTAGIPGGIGIFDANGNTGSFRSNFSGVYDGDHPTFSDATHLYAHDDETSGGEFFGYTIDANGLTKIYAVTLLEFGTSGPNGFELGADGRAYAPDGGIVNLATNPPQQIGVLPLGQGGEIYSTVNGTAVAPDSTQRRVFVAAVNVAGFSASLEAFNTADFLFEQALPLPPAPDNSELFYQAVRWGQDGIALNAVPLGGSPVSDYQILLFRGPFVLPAELAANPAPVLTVTTPANIAVSSGNQYITVTGSGFIPGAVAFWNGAQRTTNFVDSAHLSVAIPASDVSAAATTALKVDNPGSGDSNSVSLTVQ